MNRVHRSFWVFLLALSGLWWLVDQTAWSGLAGLFAWRPVLMQYTGVLGIGVMSLAMILAVRPVVLEPWLGGLDKMYRLHKWLGISGLTLAVVHWLIAQGPKWMVGWGWLVRPARGPRPQFPEDSLQQFFLNQRGLAEGIGEWAFYAAAALMVLALVKRFPYRQFFKTHKLLAVTYLALVLHSVVLLKFDYWLSPLGLVMAALMAAGTGAALMVLLRRVAADRKAEGVVASITRHEALKVVAVDIRVDDRWAGHDGGQFAYVSFDETEGPHPYTIASAWKGDGLIRFVIKGLGDYTGRLADELKVGDRVTVEGPYGRFNFAGPARRQIWIGAGIGITPFISRMEALAASPDGKAIDLFHTTATYDAGAIDLLERDAAAAAVRLYVLWDERDGRLDANRVCRTVEGWRDADVWFCGPAGFGENLRKRLVAMGFPAARFHQELFEMR